MPVAASHNPHPHPHRHDGHISMQTDAPAVPMAATPRYPQQNGPVSCQVIVFAEHLTQMIGEDQLWRQQFMQSIGPSRKYLFAKLNRRIYAGIGCEIFGESGAARSYWSR
jgi:hypothetical protein